MQYILLLFKIIAASLDDVQVATMKIAATKIAGITIDDITATKSKVSDLPAEREIPLLLRIAKISFIVNIIMLIVFFPIYYIAPEYFKYILISGGLYLSYEGAHVITEYFKSKKSKVEKEEKIDEDSIVKGAIFTIAVLSMEIITIAISSVAGNTKIYDHIISVTSVVLMATTLIFVIVAILVKADDFGAYLVEKTSYVKTGIFIVKHVPSVMIGISILGTLAMLMIGGEIFTHNIDFLHHYLTFENIILEIFKNIILGAVVGFIIVYIIEICNKIKRG